MKVLRLNNTIEAFIDDEDYDIVGVYTWHASGTSIKHRYYARASLKSNTSKTRQFIFLHHLIVGRAPKGQRILFKDNNPLNCQKSNLEFVTCSQAAHKYYNKNSRQNKSVKDYIGVSIQYQARIKYNNKSIIIGCYDNEKDAAIAYNKKAKELFGHCAQQNAV